MSARELKTHRPDRLVTVDELAYISGAHRSQLLDALHRRLASQALALHVALEDAVKVVGCIAPEDDDDRDLIAGCITAAKIALGLAGESSPNTGPST